MDLSAGHVVSINVVAECWRKEAGPIKVQRKTMHRAVGGLPEAPIVGDPSALSHGSPETGTRSAF